MFAKFRTATTATALVVTPVAAAAPTDPAASLSLAKFCACLEPDGKTYKAGAGHIAAIAIGRGIVVGITLAIMKGSDNDSDSI